jgi:hypothetical protein
MQRLSYKTVVAVITCCSYAALEHLTVCASSTKSYKAVHTLRKHNTDYAAGAGLTPSFSSSALFLAAATVTELM